MDNTSHQEFPTNIEVADYEVRSHIVHGDRNPQLVIMPTGLTDSGGAYSVYSIRARKYNGELTGFEHTIEFQNAPIGEVGINGLSGEALIAIVHHRLQCFQAGPYACESNSAAMHYLMLALWALQDRTRERIARGVEGTNKV